MKGKKLSVKIEVIPRFEGEVAEIMSCSTSYGCHGSGNPCSRDVKKVSKSNNAI